LRRNVEPELADHIPGDDPSARRFRRDLSRLNAFAMTDRAMGRTLLKHSGEAVPRELIDLGAGDGTFMLRVAQRLAPRWRDVTVKLVDQQAAKKTKLFVACEPRRTHLCSRGEPLHLALRLW
jgi:hypothetical protein